MNKIRVSLLAFFLIPLSFFLESCGKPVSNTQAVIAVVNGEQIYLKDLTRVISARIKRNPMFEVTAESVDREINMLIDNKILTQEARKEGLDKKERFLNTIKTFWEQTLVRDLIEHKNAEFLKDIPMSEAELKDYYEELKHEKTFGLIKGKDKIKITEALKNPPESVSWEEIIGPLRVNEISSDFMRGVFNLKEGENGVYKDGDTYYLFYCSKDNIVSLPEYETIKESVKRDYADHKKNGIFKEWINTVKSNSKIKIYKESVPSADYNE